MMNVYNIKNNVLASILIIVFMHTGLFAHVDKQKKDTILTVSEARIDANHDFIPDRIGQRVTLGGRANVADGILHTNRLSVFLQDSRSGIELYDTEVKMPIAEGDSVIATGVINQYEGVTQVTNAQYTVVKTDYPMPQAIALPIMQTNFEQFEGILVRLHGKVTQKWRDEYGDYICIRDHSGDRDNIIVFLSFRHARGIDFSSIAVGEQIIVTGVIGQYVRSGKLNTGYEIYPRHQEDIRIEGAVNRAYLIAVYVSLGVLVVVLFWVWMLRRQVAKQTKALRDSENQFHSIFDGTNDAIFVLRDDLMIENANPAACRLCSLSREVLVTKSLMDIFKSEHIPTFNLTSDVDRDKTALEFEMTLRSDTDKDVQLLAKMNIFEQKGARRLVLVLRDITERKQAEKEREDIIKKLTDALAEVRALSGLLPICSSCKKIRDDKGYWKLLEDYFHIHSDVRFSHSMCPDCFAKFYPTFVKKDQQTEG